MVLGFESCTWHHSLLSLCRTIALWLVLLLQVPVFAAQVRLTPAWAEAERRRPRLRCRRIEAAVSSGVLR
jgi:hypothetical protein